jgi:pyruvate dehydrogenase E1 component
MKLVPDQISRWVQLTALGTDGYGRSDTRESLRHFFEVDTGHVVVTVLSALARRGDIEAQVVADALEAYGLDPEAADPSNA